LVVIYLTLNTNKSLYFIAIVPPQPYFQQILDWKNYFAENHHSKGALRSPPHITLHMPFKWQEKREGEIHKFLRSIVIDQEVFSIQLKNFSAFEPRVIYIDVVENQELGVLQKKVAENARKSLGIFNDDYKNRGFSPHVTVAFRDLKKPEFYNAWQTFKNKEFEATFNVEDLCLLKHNGRNWEINKQYAFISSAQSSG